MANKRVVITAGGTGGHLYPAQALAQQLIQGDEPSPVLFVAGGLGKNRHFDSNRFPHKEVACSPILSKHPLKCLKGIKDLLKGTRESYRILKEFRPDVVVGFGSYYTVSILLAAKLLKIPIILHEQNSIPGRANQWLSHLACRVGVHFPHASSFFKDKAVVVGLPLREGYTKGKVNQQEAYNYFGLQTDRKTLLICGGSQGARAINQLVAECIPIFEKLNIQIIHSTGDPLKAAELTEVYRKGGIPACVKPYEPKMELAWSIADSFVGRAGAATIAESIEFEVPGILIPYPFATDNHQEKNADFLVEHVQSGMKYLEAGLSPEQLGRGLEVLFNSEQHSSYRGALARYKQKAEQSNLYQLVINL